MLFRAFLFLADYSIQKQLRWQVSRGEDKKLTLKSWERMWTKTIHLLLTLGLQYSSMTHEKTNPQVFSMLFLGLYVSFFPIFLLWDGFLFLQNSCVAILIPSIFYHKRLYLQIGYFKRCIWVKMRVLAWTLTQYEWSFHEREIKEF